MKKIEKIDFLNWAYSDLLVNNQRGHLAEYLVALALGVDNEKRIEWDAYDLKYKDLKIEIKSSAYVQAWEQTKPSVISFGVAKTRALEDNSYSQELKRQADIYIFCVLKHKDRDTINPLNIEQWDFYIVPTDIINKELGNQKTVKLSALKLIGASPVAFEKIKHTVDNL